ncbi:hypothetical protein KIW84_014738 [Lathyrus oleraceus]|uniref:Uncharacterized protein n=1 Tax=Pisum sativum TaxID=3888 RepID=A0A9D5GZP0_PEA|nr:hypothetical protein KIW84_014738 [Pisum sativum]
MSQPPSAQNVSQPPPMVATQRVPGFNQPRLVEYQVLEEIIHAIGGFYTHGLNARELCLVYDVVLMQKFKVPDLPKYKGLSCPRSHIIVNYKKMASYIEYDELLIHCFQDRLSGASLD